MTFANPLPPWALAAIVAAALVVAWLAYRYVPIAAARGGTRCRRCVSSTLLWIVVCLMRPMVRATGVAVARRRRADAGGHVRAAWA